MVAYRVSQANSVDFLVNNKVYFLGHPVGETHLPLNYNAMQ